MLSKDDIILALQSPKIAHFPVKFEIFASEDRKRIAYFKRKLAQTITDLSVECDDEKAREVTLGNIEKRYFISPSLKLLERLEIHTGRYLKVKEYFQQQIRQLGLIAPLIFFDDLALRVDIGYGPKEALTLFPDFFSYGGVFDEEILGEVSIIFGKSVWAHFLEDYITEAYRQSLEDKRKAVFSNALIAFERLGKPERHQGPRYPEGFDEVVYIKQNFQANAGLIVGEVHAHSSPKQFLVDNMCLFQRLGVKTLFMEHLLQERHQQLLDEYLALPEDAPMPIELNIYLNYLDSERGLSGTATFTNIVVVAKQHQIRIIAFDSEAIYSLGVANSVGHLYSTSAKNRYIAMNMSMVEKHQEFAGKDKYIAFMGSGHVSTCLDVPGVSELINCPSIVVQDLDDLYEEHVEHNIWIGSESHGAQFDTLYHRHALPKQHKDITTASVKLTQDLDDSHLRFEQKKLEIQAQFSQALKRLNAVTIFFPIDDASFFNVLTIQHTRPEAQKIIQDFREIIKSHIELAQKSLRVGFAKALILRIMTCIFGLLAGILMIVAALFGQGILKTAHRKQFANTFFCLNPSSDLKALEEFKQEILGDDKQNLGLISVQTFLA